jgi:hypothetical protein
VFIQLGNAELPSAVSAAEGHGAEHHREQAADDHRAEDPAPAPVVGDPANAGAGDGGAEDIAEKSRETGRGARRLFRHEIERVQADDHDRPVHEEADRDQRGDVDPERAVAVQAVHDEPGQGQHHEEDRRRRAAALEYLVRDPAAENRPRDAGELECRPRVARLLEREALRRLQVGGNPVHHAVADEVHEGVGDRDGPEVPVVEDVAEKDLLEREGLLVRRRIVGRVVVLVLLDGGQAAALRGVAQQPGDEQRDRRRHERRGSRTSRPSRRRAARPAAASFATRPPPTLCATFQIETVTPRSLVLHQCTMVLPHGGQPMPLNQPLSVCSTIIAVSEP